MSRHKSKQSYGHSIRIVSPELFRLSWTVDRYYPDSRQRFPRTTSRDTDRLGAIRFGMKWNVKIPPQ